MDTDAIIIISSSLIMGLISVMAGLNRKKRNKES